MTRSIPADDPSRTMSVVDRDQPHLRNLSLAGNTYTVLLRGADTAGRYCLIDMTVPHCGGPGPHRHDFEEMFTILEGEIEFTFRGVKRVVKAGTTVNIPANAPHFFTNQDGKTARLLCMCTPSGQEDFFEAIATPIESRTAEHPAFDDAAQAAQVKKGIELAPRYRTEMLPPS